MHQITESSCQGHGDFVEAEVGLDAAVFQVSPQQRALFFRLVCDEQAAQSFLDCYAPVHLQTHFKADEPSMAETCVWQSSLGPICLSLGL